MSLVVLHLGTSFDNPASILRKYSTIDGSLQQDGEASYASHFFTSLIPLPYAVCSWLFHSCKPKVKQQYLASLSRVASATPCWVWSVSQWANWIRLLGKVPIVWSFGLPDSMTQVLCRKWTTMLINNRSQVETSDSHDAFFSDFLGPSEESRGTNHQLSSCNTVSICIKLRLQSIFKTRILNHCIFATREDARPPKIHECQAASLIPGRWFMRPREKSFFFFFFRGHRTASFTALQVHQYQALSGYTEWHARSRFPSGSFENIGSWNCFCRLCPRLQRFSHQEEQLKKMSGAPSLYILRCQ